MIVGNDRKCFGANYGKQAEEYEGAPIDDAICVKQECLKQEDCLLYGDCLETIYYSPKEKL